MKVRILKGTHQIGGCITEITSDKGTKIIIDFGEDLPDDNNLVKPINPNIDGLTTGVKKYDAVFITHSHGDHIGLINYILPDIPVYVEPISKEIYKLISIFTYKNIRFKTNDMKFNEKTKIKDITVTPYLVDHSSYNSSMLLIESDNKRILHTGDFRSNGLKGNKFLPTLEEIGKVDLIITEGTSLSKDNIENETEEHLSQRALDVFKKYDQIFILQSSTNIDRIKGFYDISKITNKTFIEDLFTANIVDNLNDNTIPNPKITNNVYVWIPTKYNSKSIKFKQKYIFPYKKYSKKRSYNDNKYCLMVKTSMIKDIEKLYNKNHIKNACLIYSMWYGYKEKEEMKTFLDKIKQYGINKVIDLHTSGHADLKTIKLLNNLNASKVIPIHTTKPEMLSKVLNNVYLAKDEESIKI